MNFIESITVYIETGKIKAFFLCVCSVIHNVLKTFLVSLYESLSYFLPSVCTIMQVEIFEQLPMF